MGASVVGQAGGLSWGGAAVMVVSVVLVLALTIFCILRVFREREPKKHLHAPLDIDTHDVDGCGAVWPTARMCASA